ncbi:MAG TPA: ABC transporter substrate-binding protein [Stellaceae bacterium]|nr:ABC transporter substrate-binding protein [Stellaceae bacterium]
MKRLLLAAALAAFFAGAAQAADTIKIGALHTTGTGPVFIADAKGYFTAAGLDAQIVFFESAQPISIAAASGDIDIAYTGLTGGFYGLASQGVLRIVGGGARETPGFHYQPFLVSNHAWDGGLHDFKNLPGHSFGVSQIGSPPHYALGLIAEKFGFDVKTVRIQPLATIANLAAAIVGGQVDSTMMPGNTAVPVLAQKEAKLLGYIGDVAPYQLVATIVSTKTANERRDMIGKALGALKKGARDYYDAFTPGGKPGKGPNEAEILAIVAKGANQNPEDAGASLPYIDPEGRLDVEDVLRQLAWYKAQGMVKGTIGGDVIIDRRYITPLS